MKKSLSFLTAAFAALLLSGCIALTFTRDDRPVEYSPTVGQELIDLQAARDRGAITEDEFDAKKARLLKIN